MKHWCRRAAATFSGQSCVRPPGVSSHRSSYNWHTGCTGSQPPTRSCCLEAENTSNAAAALIDGTQCALLVFLQLFAPCLTFCWLFLIHALTQMQPPTVPYSTAATMQLLPVMMMTMPELNPPTCDQQCPGTLGRRSSNYKGNQLSVFGEIP